jgi:putative ATP-binding cassette transporter
MKLLLLFVRSSWLMGLVSVSLGAASGMATLGLITLIHHALSENAAKSPWLPAAFVGACIAVLVTQVSAHCLLVRLSQSTAARLRYELCNRIIKTPLCGLEAVGTWRLGMTLGHDVGAITDALTGLPGFFANVMVLICGLGYLASLSLPLAAITVVLAGVCVATYLAGQRIANRYLRQARQDMDESGEQTGAMLMGIKELKSHHFRFLDFFYGVLLPADTNMRRNLISGLSIQGFAHSWGRLCLFIGIGMLLFVWPNLSPVTVATLTGYTLTILYLTYPLDGILGWLPSLDSALIALKKIEQLGLLLDETEAQTLSPVTPPFESLELQDVTYGYTSPDGHGFTLGPINLTLTAGDEIFIAGGNGSGKTTLAKLLTGLYVPHQGRVLLNGEVVGNYIRGNYRQLFSTVFVEGRIFDRLLGVELNEARLRHWAELLEIEDKVDFKTGRFDVQKLSRGQYKRLSLLVACMDDRPILVFDEWAAEQDPGFKDVFYRQILPELRQRGKTVIAITHDDRYFSAADRVVTLVDGRLESHAKRIAA